VPAHPEEDPNVLRDIQRREREDEERSRAAREFIDQYTSEQRETLLHAAIARLLEQQEASEAQERNEAEQGERESMLDAAINWLDEKWGRAKCPYCQQGPWEIAGPFSIPVGDGEIFLSPVFTVMCSNCGQTTFVNAVRSGAVPESFETENDEP
jgi:CTP-dependent riboflavin kinase